MAWQNNFTLHNGPTPREQHVKIQWSLAYYCRFIHFTTWCSR